MGSGATAAAMVAAGTPRRHLSQAMGYMSMANFVAMVSGPMVGGLLGAAIGIRRTFFVAAGFYLVAGLVVLFLVREIVNPDAGDSRSRRGKGDRRLLANPNILLMLAVLVFVNIAPSLSRPVIPLVLQSFDAAASSGEAGLVFSATALASATAAFLSGRVSGRTGYKRTLVVALVCAGLAYLPVTRVDSLPQLLVLMTAVGLFSGGLLPSCNSLLGSYAPAGRQGAVFGLAGSAQAVSIALGPMTGGVIAATFGIRSGFIVSGALLVGVGLLVALSVREPAQEDEPGA
jgi:MFS family permease